MNTEFSPEQIELRDMLDGLLSRHRTTANAQARAYLESPELERDLAASGYLELARTEGYGLFAAAMLVEAVAQLPQSVEVGASALVAAGLSPELAIRPMALAGTLIGTPIRYLPRAQAVLFADGDAVRLLATVHCRVREVQTQFAYPIGIIDEADLSAAVVVAGATRVRFQALWQLALAAEACGLMRASVDLTVGYLKERKQFGRAIGSFQALQHRIAECASMLESAQVLMHKAAGSGDAADAALAAYYVQDVAPRIVLDCQQMHGAMGCTLEYPLHFWTYRLKVLQGEFGGAFAQADRAAALLWS